MANERRKLGDTPRLIAAREGSTLVDGPRAVQGLALVRHLAAIDLRTREQELGHSLAKAQAM